MLAPSIYSLAAKRRKTAKKWDDFDYYEDESKTSEVEGCDGADHPMPAQHFQLPLRTGKKKCRECKEEFSTKKAILSHRCHQTKRKEREKVTYTCKGCLRRFLLRREYLKHADVCYKNTPVTCSLCLVRRGDTHFFLTAVTPVVQMWCLLSKSVSVSMSMSAIVCSDQADTERPPNLLSCGTSLATGKRVIFPSGWS